METAIRIENLSKRFESQKVLNGIELDLPKGRSLAVLGRSGTGKSVLLKLIIGLLEPDTGSVFVSGQSITTMEENQRNEIRRNIGFLFQHGALYDSLTVEDNVEFPLRRHTTLSSGKRKSRVRELLSRVGMEEASSKMPSEISGGMKKRAALARALVLDPGILLLDEPTAGLDPITAKEIDGLIAEMQNERNISTIVVTHDIRDVKVLSDEMAFLDKGKIVAKGNFEELSRSEDPFVSKFFQESQ